MARRQALIAYSLADKKRVDFTAESLTRHVPTTPRAVDVTVIVLHLLCPAYLDDALPYDWC